MIDPDNPFGLNKHSQQKVASYWRGFKKRSRAKANTQKHTVSKVRKVGWGVKWNWETNSRDCKGHYAKTNPFCTDVCDARDRCWEDTPRGKRQ